MPPIEELEDRAKQVESDMKEYNLGVFIVEKFIFENLLNLETSHYSISQLFSRDSITQILQIGRDVINEGRKGKKMWRLGSGGPEANKVPPAEDYEKLFNNWAAAGWIAMNECETVPSSIEVSFAKMC